MDALFVDKSMAMRLELAEAQMTARYAWSYANLYPGSGACATPIAGGYVAFAGSRSPLSRATGMGLRNPVKAAELDMVEDYLRYRRARPTIDICPFVNESFLELIGDRDYKVFHFLDQYIRPLVPGKPAYTDFGPGIAITPMQQRSDADLELWSRTVAQGFAGTDDRTPPYIDMFRSMFRTLGIVCFLATVDGEVAGGGALKVLDRTALLSTASTLPEFRRNGVQSALLKARLSAAAEAGCDLAAVMTQPGDPAQRNVIRHGFRMAYARMTMVRGPRDLI